MLSKIPFEGAGTFLKFGDRDFMVVWATTTMKSLSPDFRNFPASSNGIFDSDRLYLDHKVRMRQSTDLDRCTGR